MSLGPLWWGPPSPGAAADLLGELRQEEVTYDHVGSTLEPDRWPGRRARQRQRDVGRGESAFAAAIDRLRTWEPQKALGADVLPSDQMVAADATILLVLPFGPLRAVVPDRVVAVVEEPRRFAFAYGTLPGHAERGEESFSVELLDDGTVRATVRVDARPASRWLLATPAIAILQAAAIRRYLAALLPPP